MSEPSDKLKSALSGLGKIPEQIPHIVHCRRCGQELKDPESIKLGIGPVCRGKELAEGDEENDDVENG